MALSAASGKNHKKNTLFMVIPAVIIVLLLGSTIMFALSTSRLKKELSSKASKFTEQSKIIINTNRTLRKLKEDKTDKSDQLANKQMKLAQVGVDVRRLKIEKRKLTVKIQQAERDYRAQAIEKVQLQSKVDKIIIKLSQQKKLCQQLTEENMLYAQEKEAWIKQEAQLKKRKNQLIGGMAELEIKLDKIKKELAISPTDFEAYYALGITYFKEKEYQTALQYFNKVLTINHRYTNAYKNRGYLYMVLGEKRQACLDWKTACQHGVCDNYRAAQKQGDCQ